MRHELDAGAQPGLATVSAYQLSQGLQAGAHGARDALNNYPPANAASPSQTEANLRARVAGLHDAVRQEVSKRLDLIAGDVMALREHVVEERYVAQLRSVETGIRGALAQQGGRLERLVHDALKARREYVYFNYANRLSSDPRPEPAAVILAWLTVPLVIESLLNGLFFADASEFGLVGGTATATIISGVNVALGFLLGLWPARYCRHVRASHLFWALPVYAGLIALLLLFNLAVGHYRELLLADPDAASYRVLSRLVAEPFAIQDLKSLSLVLIGCIIASLSARKGFGAVGSYPGQAAAYRHWRERCDAVEAEKSRLDADLTPELEALRRSSDGYRDACVAALLKLQKLRAAAEALREQYESRLSQLRAARDAVASEYRDANFMVRTDMPPAYFSRRLALSDIDGPVELSAYDNVARLIGDIEHQLQQMPALIEAKLKDQLALVNGLDLIGEVERLKLRSMEAGRAAFLQDEAERRDAAAAFAATAR